MARLLLQAASDVVPGEKENPAVGYADVLEWLQGDEAGRVVARFATLVAREATRAPMGQTHQCIMPPAGYEEGFEAGIRRAEALAKEHATVDQAGDFNPPLHVVDFTAFDHAIAGELAKGGARG